MNPYPPPGGVKKYQIPFSPRNSRPTYYIVITNSSRRSFSSLEGGAPLSDSISSALQTQERPTCHERDHHGGSRRGRRLPAFSNPTEIENQPQSRIRSSSASVHVSLPFHPRSSASALRKEGRPRTADEAATRAAIIINRALRPFFLSSAQVLSHSRNYL